VGSPWALATAYQRHFSAAYKLRILAGADWCVVPGRLIIFLRREGLYSSHLAQYSSHCAQGTLASLASQRRGQTAVVNDPTEFARFRKEKENERMAHIHATAEAITEIPNNFHAVGSDPGRDQRWRIVVMDVAKALA
jgi:transposase